MHSLKYTINSATQLEITEHLERCKLLFEPPLDIYINIKEYSQKLFEKSFRFEARCDSILIGLVAVYFLPDKTFISSFSIEKDWIGKGVSKELIKRVIDKSKDQNLNWIYLEVFKENKRAISFYSKYGFGLDKEDENKLILSRNI
ncbi:MAG: GNAT family N-acetyltransferase [Bacteroidota bacterium]